MRSTRHHHTPALALACLLVALVPLFRDVRLARAALAQGGSFASAVPCLLGEDAFATTCFADTIFNRPPAGDPALVQLGLATKVPLAPVGARSGDTSTRISNGIGSVYGLAYDDGSASGARRLFAAAYTRRLSSFGPGGPGGVYAYDFAARSWSLAFVVPGAGWGRPRAADTYDSDAIAQAGLTGLGDMEVSPDGRELFIVNIASRRIERYSLAASPPARGTPITIDDGARNANDALDAVWAQHRGAGWYSPALEQSARADTVPFALEFSPLVTADGPLLALGLTDTNRRGVQVGGTSPPLGVPALHVALYRLNAGASQPWARALSQDLDAPSIRDRFRDSGILGFWTLPPYHARGLRGWNPWHNNLAAMPQFTVMGLGATIVYPQPLLTDIEFSHDARRVYLGLRDRTGDQVFAAEAPPGQFSAIAQGDTLVYNVSGSSWLLQTTARTVDPANTNPDDAFVRPAPSDYFDDNRHDFDPALSSPLHIENHLGALATTLQGTAGNLTERVATTTLLGKRRSGIAFYGQDGGYWSAPSNTLVTPSAYNGGKGTALGDLEPLCTYAFVAGRLWRDLDGDGFQDAGEPGIAGVRLEAFRGHPTLAPADATVMTDATGAYRFALPPNTDYRIRISATDRAPGGATALLRFSPHNAAGDDTRDSDAAQRYGYVELAGTQAAPTTGATGAAITTPLREQELTNIDIGLTPLPGAGAIGDLVWEDQDADGLQDANEPGLSAAALRTMTITLVPDPLTATIVPPAALTAARFAGGGYLFQNLPPGSYAVRFDTLPAGYAVSPTRVRGASDTTDSDAGPTTGMLTRFVALADAPAGTLVNRNLDLGLAPAVVDLSVSIAGPASVLPGQPVDYTVTARNLSLGATAQNVVVTHDLPPGTSFSSAGGSSPGPSRAGQRLTWSVGALAAGESRAWTVRVTAPGSLEPPAPGQRLVTSAAIRTTSPDINSANDAANHSTLLVRPELSVVKSALPSAPVDAELGYTLEYRNSGSAPAANVTIGDRLPPGLTFLRFVTNPGGACGYDTATRTVSCALGSLPAVAPGNSGTVAFVVRPDPATAGASVTNTAVIGTPTVGDTPAANSSSATTALLWPDPGVAIVLAPAEPAPPGASFPVGTAGAIQVRYSNGLAPTPPGELRGPARDAALEITLPEGGLSLGQLPPGCSGGAPRVRCALGTLGADMGGVLTFPVRLAPEFAADQLGVAATITTSSPERAATLSDNSSRASVTVVRPNLFVDAQGPRAVVGRGSVFWYTLDYGNLYRSSPALTRRAEGVVLRATLPADVELVQAEMPPDSVDGRTLTWRLGGLAPRSTGRIVLVVRTDVAAGASLHLDAVISTDTPGDEPTDNRDAVDTDVVLPPDEIPASTGEIRLALRSELDPNSRDGSPENGVYLTDGPRFTWPAGEVLDLTPRLRELTIPGEAELPYPYAYRARVVGWSLRSVTIDGNTYDPTGTDSGGRAGCRPGDHTADEPRLLEGCAYGYLDGGSIEAIRRSAPLREEQLRRQAHLYWTHPPAPPLRDDVYLYAVERLVAVRLTVQVELELHIVNAAPGEIGGVLLPEVPVVPLPDPERQIVSETFEMMLLVPRSVVGPGTQ